MSAHLFSLFHHLYKRWYQYLGIPHSVAVRGPLESTCLQMCVYSDVDTCHDIDWSDAQGIDASAHSDAPL